LRRAASRLALGLVLAVAACRSAAPPGVSKVPDPLQQPAPGAALSPAAQRAVANALAAAERADFTGAAKAMASLPSDHPVTRLVTLEVKYLQGGSVSEEALALARGESSYGAAWAFASQAAEQEGRLAEAADAASHAAALLPGKGWDATAARLGKAVTESKLQAAITRLQSGDATGALAVATELLTANPALTPARLLATRAELALGNVAGAAAMLPALPDSPEGLELKGQVAERLGQWDLAVQFYTRLPESNPRRCELLEAARAQWRLANAPPQVTKALAAARLTRRALAALLVWKVPGLADQAAGSVPVFEDVVNLPERSDLIVAARTGLMPGDALTRRFGAERTVTPRELTQVLGRLARLLGRPEPSWCGDTVTEGCVAMPQTLDGAAAASLIDAVVPEEKPCQS
jgi:tetratricopeptide (TPR) repeat protein